MKKTFLITSISLLALGGCAKYHRDPDANSVFCQKIIHQMHSVPPRYNTPASNRQLATTQARLKKDYSHYNCEMYEYRKAAKKQAELSATSMQVKEPRTP